MQALQGPPNLSLLHLHPLPRLQHHYQFTLPTEHYPGPSPRHRLLSHVLIWDLELPRPPGPTLLQPDPLEYSLVLLPLAKQDDAQGLKGGPGPVVQTR